MGKVGPNGLQSVELGRSSPCGTRTIAKYRNSTLICTWSPKLKKTWVKKQGPIGDYFKDFVQQLAQQYIHTQLDKLTTDIHRRVVTGVDAESKRLVLHCDFSQDLAHAMADQSMCEYFDSISSSLFIAVAHFWDPVTNKRECEGVMLPFFLSFLSKHPIQCLINTFNRLL